MNSGHKTSTLMKLRFMFLIVWMCTFVALTEGFVFPVLAAKVATVIIATSGFLPGREDLPSSVSIPAAITKFYPLPEEELTTAYNRGNSYLVLGRFEEALNEFNRAVELAPLSSDVFLSRGIAEEKVEKWEEAISDYQKSNELYRKKQFPFPRDDPTAISNLANAETGLNRWTEAYTDFSKAASLSPDFLAPQIGKALVAYQLHRPEETFAFFQKLAIQYPSYADANAVLATLYWEKGDVPSGNDCWESALEQDSRYKDIDWVLNIRRWPPLLVQALEKGLVLRESNQK